MLKIYVCQKGFYTLEFGKTAEPLHQTETKCKCSTHKGRNECAESCTTEMALKNAGFIHSILLWRFQSIRSDYIS